MTATDELRRLLDERGVEWKNETAFMQGQEHLMTTWKSMDGKTVAYSEFEYPHMKKLRIYDCTPEQAIAATLGDVPYLPHWWTHDGTLHVELPKLPESISVRLPDQRDREVGSARTWQYTLGAGTCHYEIAFFGDDKAWFACSECGGMASADYDPPKYCPHCGRKVVDA